MQNEVSDRDQEREESTSLISIGKFDRLARLYQRQRRAVVESETLTSDELEMNDYLIRYGTASVDGNVFKFWQKNKTVCNVTLHNLLI